MRVFFRTGSRHVSSQNIVAQSVAICLMQTSTKRVWCSNRVQQLVLYLPVKSCSLLQLVDVGNRGNFSQAPRNSKTEPCPSAASKDNRRFQRNEDFGAKHEQIYHFAEQPLSSVKIKHILLLGTILGPGYAVGEKGKEELNKKKIGERSQSRGAKKKNPNRLFFFANANFFFFFPQCVAWSQARYVA